MKVTGPDPSQALRHARITAIAVEMIGDKPSAHSWLNTPNRALGGEKPVDRIGTDAGVQAVEDVLGRIAYGVYS